MQRTTFNLVLLALLAILCLVGWMGWELFALHVNEPARSSPEDAQAIIGVALPPEARNVRIAEMHQFQQYAQYVRFEAPVEVCTRYAQKVSGTLLMPIDDAELKTAGRFVRADAFHDLSWFDLASAHDVVTAGGGPNVAYVWVDRSRGVFYFRMTD